ncbi:MAG: hypothetical protein LBR53_02370 [Deltaproteobacteria bacterium]|nr:hypothetical protein [Deltaproteobacteria bacterium]
MLPAKKGHHLFLTSKAIKQCSKTELKSMFLYALSLSVNNDYKEMLKMLSVFLIPSLILGLFLKAIYLPLVFEFRFISIKSLRRLLLKGYKWLISDTRLTERFSLAFTLTYVCFPAAAVLLTSCSRKLVAKADAAACERAGLIDYVYSIYNARYGIAKVSAMEIEFTPLKFKRIFYGLFITPGLSRRLKLLKYV